MPVRRDLYPLAWGKPDGTEVVEQHERANHRALARRQEPANGLPGLVDVIPAKIVRERAATHETTLPEPAATVPALWRENARVWNFASLLLSGTCRSMPAPHASSQQ